jgi:hypothetical protein
VKHYLQTTEGTYYVYGETKKENFERDGLIMHSGRLCRRKIIVDFPRMPCEERGRKYKDI